VEERADEGAQPEAILRGRIGLLQIWNKLKYRLSQCTPTREHMGKHPEPSVLGARTGHRDRGAAAISPDGSVVSGLWLLEPEIVRYDVLTQEDV
jgi:hypothetical protein